MRKRYLLLLLSAVLPALARGQADALWTPAPAPHYTFIAAGGNTIAQPQALDNVLKKLQRIRHTRKGTVSIVHIGDSHLQADGITRVVRNEAHQYFGDAGRGLVFPYQVAGSNAPKDVFSSSNVKWANGKLTNSNMRPLTGICGYYLQTGKAGAILHLRLKPQDSTQEYFNRMVFFLGRQRDSYKLTDSALATPKALATVAGVDTPSVVLETDTLMTGFGLGKSTLPGEDNFEFYGVSLERKDAPGVLYHTIGVNGACYEQYTANDLFWHQVAALHGDLFIVSMGTNEAQRQGITEADMTAAVDAFVKRIRNIAPKADILLTTPAGSYYRKKKPNVVLQRVADAFSKYSERNKIACWDLYTLSGGKASAQGWKKNGMLGGDLVHYNMAGYELQGALLLNAFAAAYNKYERQHPYKAEVVAIPKIIVAKPTPQPIAKEVIKPAATPPPAAPQPAVPAPAPPKQDPVNEPPPPKTKNIKVEYMD